MNQKGFNALLATGDSSPKLTKSNHAGLGYLSAIQYLAPVDLSGFNVCQHASAGCKIACLNTSGRGRYQKTQQARIARTRYLFLNPSSYLILLTAEIQRFSDYCKKRGQKAAIRLNGTSDLPFWSMYPVLFGTFSEVQFYDYTKAFGRMIEYLNGNLPPNYHLTFSRSEVNEPQCLEILKLGGNVAVVFQKEFPLTWNNFPVCNGDKHDLTFLHTAPIVGLKAKGKAKQDKSGFVVGAK